MTGGENRDVRKPYAAPRLTVHGDVRAVTQSAVSMTTTLDGATKGNSKTG